jgi:hypothetical protein
MSDGLELPDTAESNKNYDKTPEIWTDWRTRWGRALAWLLAPDWALRWVAYKFRDTGIVSLLETAGKFAIVIVLVQWWHERDQRVLARHNLDWSLILAARGSMADAGRYRAIEDLTFDRVSLYGLPMEHAAFNGLALRGADLVRSNFSHAELWFPDFTNASLIAATFDNIHITEGLFEAADMKGASFQNATLNDVDFTGARLSYIDFTGTHFIFGPGIFGARKEQALRDALSKDSGVAAADVCRAVINGVSIDPQACSSSPTKKIARCHCGNHMETTEHFLFPP